MNWSLRVKKRRQWIPGVEQSESRLLLSVATVDPRVEVTQTTVAPYNSLVSIETSFGSNKDYTGSGVMLDSTHVLTVAHNIFGRKNGGWAKTVTVSPERTGDLQPVGSYQVTRETTYTAYIHKPRFNDDLAVLTISQPISNPSNVMQVGVMNNNANQETVWTAGYPGDKPQFTMWQAIGHAEGSKNRLSQFNLASFQGQSGSPIVEGTPDKPAKVISLVGGGADGVLHDTIGPQFTTKVTRDIKFWETLDAVPAKSRLFHPIKGQPGTAAIASFMGPARTHLLSTI